MDAYAQTHGPMKPRDQKRKGKNNFSRHLIWVKILKMPVTIELGYYL